MEKPVVGAGVLGLLLSLSGTAAAYAPECSDFARRLAQDPASMGSGELDVLRGCIAELQRLVVAGEPLPAGSSAPLCPPPPAPPPAPVAAECPPCPPVKACPRADKPEDPVRQRYIPRY